MAMFPVVEVSGGAFERGRTHGERARGVMHVAPDVPSRAEYQPVALAGEPVPA